MIAALMVVLVFALVLTGCKKEEKKESYVFATDATWPPLEFVEDGTLTGFEVELVPLIGEKVGVPMSVKTYPGTPFSLALPMVPMMELQAVLP